MTVGGSSDTHPVALVVEELFGVDEALGAEVDLVTDLADAVHRLDPVSRALNQTLLHSEL